MAFPSGDMALPQSVYLIEAALHMARGSASSTARGAASCPQLQCMQCRRTHCLRRSQYNCSCSQVPSGRISHHSQSPTWSLTLQLAHLQAPLPQLLHDEVAECRRRRVGETAGRRQSRHTSQHATASPQQLLIKARGVCNTVLTYQSRSVLARWRCGRVSTSWLWRHHTQRHNGAHLVVVCITLLW